MVNKQEGFIETMIENTESQSQILLQLYKDQFATQALELAEGPQSSGPGVI